MARSNPALTILFGVVYLLFAVAAEAAVVAGTVTDADKHPIVGAMVSVRDDTRGFFETVYTDPGGRFSLTTTQEGDLELRARKLSFADATQPLHLDAGSSVALNLR